PWFLRSYDEKWSGLWWSSLRLSSWCSLCCTHCCSGVFDGGADAGVGATTADVATHGSIDVGVRRVFIGLQQGRCAHELARLAVTTLRHVVLDPSDLQGVVVVFGQTFNRANFFARNSRQRRLTSANRCAVEVNRACPAQSRATTELGAGHAQFITYDPQQGCVWFGIGADGFAVDVKLDAHGEISRKRLARKLNSTQSLQTARAKQPRVSPSFVSFELRNSQNATRQDVIMESYEQAVHATSVQTRERGTMGVLSCKAMTVPLPSVDLMDIEPFKSVDISLTIASPSPKPSLVPGLFLLL
ncbi:MAG: hypothetical protein RL018_465, partial [Pseudomonadota bacterium]